MSSSETTATKSTARAMADLPIPLYTYVRDDGVEVAAGAVPKQLLEAQRIGDTSGIQRFR